MPAVMLAPEAPPLVLAPSDAAPAKARRYLTDRFRELGHADDFVGRLVVTELVTNSYKHVGIGHIIVRIFPDVREPLTVIEVWECATRRLVVFPAQPGEDWRFSLGLMAYPDPKGKGGQ
ncbi:hypothetical protein [Actinomadura sp. 6K520]|uniref:hypothetical protein n=1 Tax=Actinomadura sp. 6K520 TaxID=2530364 RepID=UPI00104718EB|nr:hypothetical protein [Actinomadura sp. 6K520]TDE26345.1 hypothetical protein E1289_25830 [Actinomadura sp. 6K520]